MYKIKKIKNFVFSFITIWILTPVITADAFAGGQINNWKFFEITSTDSVGYALGASLGKAIFTLIANPYLFPIFILAGCLLHRKYIIPIFSGLFLLMSIGGIVIGEFRISKFAVLYFVTIIAILISFSSSSIFNKIRKKKYNFSEKDPLALMIMIIVNILFFFIPIDIGTIFN